MVKSLEWNWKTQQIPDGMVYVDFVFMPLGKTRIDFFTPAS